MKDIQLHNSKDIVNAVKQIKNNQQSIMDKEDANQKLIKDANSKIEALQTEQGDLKNEYSALKGSHSDNENRIEAIKK